MKNYFIKKAINNILKNTCGKTVPRSGDEVPNVNCFALILDKGEDSYLIKKKIDDKTILGHKWVDNKFDESSTEDIEINKLNEYQFRLTHFYGEYNIQFTSLNDYMLHYYTRVQYLKIFLQRLQRNFLQYVFNRKELSSKQRTELLKTMLELQLNIDAPHSTSDLITISALTQKLYTNNIYGHPKYYQIFNELELNLKSLEETKDISYNSTYYGYSVNPKALITIEKYEIEERRHRDSIVMQNIMGWLTLGIIIVTGLNLFK